MKRKLLILFTFAATLLFDASASVAPKGWEPAKNDYAEAKTIVKEAEIEISTAPSIIIVTTSRQVKIQVFTILGRLVSSETIPPGTSQLSIPAHGVYIVKVGELTCKIAV